MLDDVPRLKEWKGARLRYMVWGILHPKQELALRRRVAAVWRKKETAARREEILAILKEVEKMSKRTPSKACLLVSILIRSMKDSQITRNWMIVQPEFKRVTQLLWKEVESAPRT